MPARSKVPWLALGLNLVTALAYAAAPLWPTPEMIDREWKARPVPDLQRTDLAPRQAIPYITPGRPELDIEEIARRHIQLEAVSSGEAPALRIFVSLAMPEQSLRLLVMQAERARATLVLRGLEANSMKQTLDHVQALIGERKVAWQIDPEAFTRYSVRHAPTFVLTRATNLQASPAETCASCASAEPFFSVAGDVSLDYALDAIVRRHADAARYAKPFLDRTRPRP